MKKAIQDYYRSMDGHGFGFDSEPIDHIDRQFLIDAIKGRDPQMSHFHSLEKDGFGQYRDSTGWRWHDQHLHSLEEHRLRSLYALLRNDGWH